MSARTAEDVHHLFTEFLLAGDLDGLVSLYEADAVMVMVPQPGPVFRGRAAIREGLSELLAFSPQFELQILKTLEIEDIAILYARWNFAGTDPDGNAVRMTGLTSDVVRRQPDGSWLVVIDNPVGGEGILAGLE
jgi:uncharacterized protein (TIGR02246 family)